MALNQCSSSGSRRRVQDIKKKVLILKNFRHKKGKFSKHPYVHQHFDIFALPMPFLVNHFKVNCRCQKLLYFTMKLRK